MSRFVQGEDVTVSVVTAAGAPIAALGAGVSSFSAQPDTEVVTAKLLSGTRKSQTFNGWKGKLTLDLQDTAALSFVDAYLALLNSGVEFRVAIQQRVFDAKTLTRKVWTYPRCVLTFQEGDYQRAQSVKLSIDWETGENRIPG